MQNQSIGLAGLAGQWSRLNRPVGARTQRRALARPWGTLALADARRQALQTHRMEHLVWLALALSALAALALSLP